jgi:hypothetical protein
MPVLLSKFFICKLPANCPWTIQLRGPIRPSFIYGISNDKIVLKCMNAGRRNLWLCIRSWEFLDKLELCYVTQRLSRIFMPESHGFTSMCTRPFLLAHAGKFMSSPHFVFLTPLSGRLRVKAIGDWFTSCPCARD